MNNEMNSLEGTFIASILGNRTLCKCGVTVEEYTERCCDEVCAGLVAIEDARHRFHKAKGAA